MDENSLNRLFEQLKSIQITVDKIAKDVQNLKIHQSVLEYSIVAIKEQTSFFVDSFKQQRKPDPLIKRPDSIVKPVSSDEHS
jgi:hypothetical protein